MIDALNFINSFNKMANSDDFINRKKIDYFLINIKI